MMQIDIITGFLGAGKTTLIQKLLAEKALGDGRIALIENELGQVPVDGALMRQTGVEIRELASGCICCSLVGDFSKALGMLIRQVHPDRILIEPSGVGKLSEVLSACRQACEQYGGQIGMRIAVVHAQKYQMYARNFAEFFLNQIRHAGTVVLSRSQLADAAQLQQITQAIRLQNPGATIITTPWDQLGAQTLVDAAMQDALQTSLPEQLLKSVRKTYSASKLRPAGAQAIPQHAGDDFQVWGQETARRFDRERITHALAVLDGGSCGQVLRAKGIVQLVDGSWVQFHLVPGEYGIADAAPDYTGRLCVIGVGLDQPAIQNLLGEDGVTPS